MEAWTKSRTCVICSAPFALRDHNNDDAKYAAKHLEDGTLDPSVLPVVVSRCPNCLAGRTPISAQTHTPQADSISTVREQQAVAAALAIAQNIGATDHDELYYYAKRIGLFVGLLSIGGIVLVLSYNQIDAENYRPLPWIIGLGITGLTGFGVSAWVFLQSGEGK